jgi:hypothetical protein
MPPLFSRAADRRLRRVLWGTGALAIAVPALLMLWVRSPEVTGQHSVPEQPVLFSHAIHAGAAAIDCRYCHSGVERSAQAGMPSSASCLPCHAPLRRNSRLFEPVRRSVASGRPIPWRRVNRLPDHVYFNHAIHQDAGVRCGECHGRVERMSWTEQSAPLTMGWCLDCHRSSAPHPPLDADAARRRESGPGERSARDVRHLTTCTACHR